MIVLIPVNTYFFGQLTKYRSETLKHSDARVRLTNEVLQGVSAIKSYKWEKPFISLLNKIRKDELSAFKKSANFGAIPLAIRMASPSIVAVISLGVYSLLGNELTTAEVFYSRYHSSIC